MTTFASFSPFTVSLIQVFFGLIMLVGGGEFLVSSASKIARIHGLSSLVIGLTVVAFGTSVPELFVSITASMQGYPDIMIGNVVGSNIANVGLILGFSAILAPLGIRYETIRKELYLVIAASLILIGCSVYGVFPRPVGFLFIFTLGTYTYLACKKDRSSNKNNNNETRRKRSKFLLYFLLVISLIFLAAGSNIFIKGAADIARQFGVSELIIGLTLAAVGTSLPELASSVAALRRGEAKMLIGNIVGSNMFNLFMVLGLTAIIQPFNLPDSLIKRDLPVMLAFSLILIPIIRYNHGTNRWHGCFILGAYCLYCYCLI